MLERLVGHHRPQIGAADADVDDVADWLAGVAAPRTAAYAIGKIGHAVEHRSPSTRIDCPFGARSATCRTARFSETLIFSPPNIASFRARSPDCSASCNSRASVSSVIRFFE